MLMTEKEILKMRKQYRALHEAMAEAEKTMYKTGDEIRRITVILEEMTLKITGQYCKMAAALTELGKMLNNEMTILGVPGEIQDDEFELESGQVEYDEEQCARNK